MASLFDCLGTNGVIKSIGCDGDTHRRLVDMGLLGASYAIKARRNGGALVDYGDFSAVTRFRIAREIEVEEK
ncbi:MAG: ferrous iron transport protein A [Clostridiales bacterium]|nr:ferrous iron transport protein A [Clostridiales bacterium]